MKSLFVYTNHTSQLQFGCFLFACLLFLTPDADDAERFFGRREEIRDYQRILDQFPFAFICLTAGKDGVWYKSKSGSWDFRPAIPVNSVVDTTGAGDAFWAGFLHSYLDGLHADASIHNGLVMAARKIQKAGPLYQ